MQDSYRPTITLLGGFLGAGKTTLMLRAAHLLSGRGTRVAVITNDQAAGLVDTRLATATGTADPHVTWLFQNQLREADIVCFGKADLFSAYPPLDTVVDFHLSARTGFGIDEWLREVLAGSRICGAHLKIFDRARTGYLKASVCRNGEAPPPMATSRRPPPGGTSSP